VNKRYLGVGAGVAAAALVLSACTPPGSDGGEAAGGSDGPSVLNVGWNEPFRSMNTETVNGNAVANSNLTYMMNDNFKHYDGNLELVDGTLGTVEQVSEDPLQVKYTFADTATWSDGTPVDAADIVLHWAAKSTNFNTESDEDVAEDRDEESGDLAEQSEGDVYFDSASPGAGLIKDFPEISEDGKSVTFEYSKPFADWELELGFGADGVGLPSHIVAKKALGIDDPQEAKQAILDAFENKDNEALSKIANTWNTGFNFTSLPDDEDLLIHNGPYKMTGFAEGQNLTLEKDEAYTGPTDPKIDQVVVRYNEDPMAGVQGIENGELDIIQPQATADVLSASEAIDGVEVISEDGGTYEHVDLTFDNGGPFDPETYGGDEEKAKLVRQAFLKTLPRQQILDTIIKPLNDEAVLRDSYTMFPGSPMYDGITGGNGLAEEYPGSDAEGAKALLEEAGVESPKVRVLYGASNERRAQQFTLIKEQAEAAGFEIIEDGDDNWGTRLGDGTYDASLFGWQSTNTGVTESDANFRTGQQNNYGGYSNEKVDGLYDELQVETDEGRQEEILTEVESTLVDDAFGVTLFQHPELTIYRDRLQNVSSITVSPTMFWNYWEWEVS
jgi:peptide/nickel transport system substrate-binding protein